jgi:indole-3-acetate monooxygenase
MEIETTNLVEMAAKLGPAISQNIDEEENGRRLSKPVLNSLKEAGLLKLFLPQSLGGMETDPLTVAKVVEAIARHNTAAGWSMMVANTSAWWCNRLPEKGIEEIYSNGPDTFIAGAFHPPMKASQVAGGYSITGRSPLTSNVHEADWIFVTAFVMEQGQMKFHNSIPEIIGVFMDAADCEIIDTWHTLGMKATDSNDVAANDVFVPSHRSYPLAPDFQPNCFYRGPLYKLPALCASIASLIIPVALAVARNAIEELKALAEKKVPFGSMVSIREKGSVQRKLGMAEAFVQSSRCYLHETITSCWNKTVAGKKISHEERAELLLSVTHGNQTCVQAVDMMYSAAGTNGIYTRNKLAHYFTDAQVIRQHGFSNDSRYETAAQIYFGLQPDLAVVMF